MIFMPFSFTPKEVPEVILITPKQFSDKRGFFLENFKESDFKNYGIITKFTQDNFSRSTQNVLRGLHYQKNPKAQVKLVSALRGEIFDVVVDIRKGSPTYGKWVAEILSDKNHNILYIPEGFAHGFCVISETADVLYKISNEYSPEHEKGIIWNDPMINIAWPIDKPVLHEKDHQLSLLKDADNNFVY